MWGCMPATPALGRLRQKKHCELIWSHPGLHSEHNASLNSQGRSSLKKHEINKKKKYWYNVLCLQEILESIFPPFLLCWQKKILYSYPSYQQPCGKTWFTFHRGRLQCSQNWNSGFPHLDPSLWSTRHYSMSVQWQYLSIASHRCSVKHRPNTAKSQKLILQWPGFLKQV